MENKAEHALHKPVMASEVTEFLNLEKGYTVLDATVGCGGHAELVLENIGPEGLFIGIDRDQKSLDIARERLKAYGSIAKLVKANFSDVDTVLKSLNVERINGAIFDLGISSYQLGDASRGFSFEREGLLDMRMDLSQGKRAYDVVNRYNRNDLERVIKELGEERYYRRITNAILERRRRAPITKTSELSELIRAAAGKKYASRRIHPATRTFQAIRIEVNNELSCIREALERIAGFLSAKARLCVISFHSLEDRIVKFKFRDFKAVGIGKILTRKPLRPGDEEIRSNPRSRSAKLRVFEKN